MDGPSEALDAPRNCEPNGTRAGLFWEKDPEPLDSQRVPLCKKGLKTHFPRPFSTTQNAFKMK